MAANSEHRASMTSALSRCLSRRSLSEVVILSQSEMSLSTCDYACVSQRRANNGAPGKRCARVRGGADRLTTLGIDPAVEQSSMAPGVFLHVTSRRCEGFVLRVVEDACQGARRILPEKWLPHRIQLQQQIAGYLRLGPQIARCSTCPLNITKPKTIKEERNYWGIKKKNYLLTIEVA